MGKHIRVSKVTDTLGRETIVASKFCKEPFSKGYWMYYCGTNSKGVVASTDLNKTKHFTSLEEAKVFLGVGTTEEVLWEGEYG